MKRMNTPNRRGTAAVSKLDSAHKQIRHIHADSLGLHVLGDLPILQRTVVEEHLSRCGTCRSALQRMADIIAVFRAAPYEAAA
jgi:anti-sigma factor RsiW